MNVNPFSYATSSFSDLLILVRFFGANPSAENERVLHQLLKDYWVQLPIKASPKLLRLRLFLFRQDQAFNHRRKFKAYVAREWLIQFSRTVHKTATNPCRGCSGTLNSMGGFPHTPNFSEAN